MAKMELIKQIRHQVAIAGQVTDKQMGRAIGGAMVELTSSPSAFKEWLSERKKQYGDRWDSMDQRADRTRTAPDGHFHFIDLPDGQYTLSVSLPSSGSRYGTAKVNVTVSVNANGNVTMASANIDLPPTTIKGKVTKQGSGAVAMAEVRVKGSRESVFSDSKGLYLLTGLEKGQRTVLASARSCQEKSIPIKVNKGEVHTQDFVLDPVA